MTKKENASLVGKARFATTGCFSLHQTVRRARQQVATRGQAREGPRAAGGALCVGACAAQRGVRFSYCTSRCYIKVSYVVRIVFWLKSRSDLQRFSFLERVLRVAKGRESSCAHGEPGTGKSRRATLARESAGDGRSA